MTRAAPATWRSLMFVPATGEKFIAKAHTRGADVIILDLEDSVPPGEKRAARAALTAAAATVGQAGAEVAVRINRPLEHAVLDIAAAVKPAVGTLVLPKVMGPEHVHLLSEVVAAHEAAQGMEIGHTRFVAVVETPDALALLPAIAMADPRVVALGLGVEDLATEIEAIPSADMIYHFAMMVVTAARAARIQPMGSVGPFADFSDLAAYRASLKRSRALGFACQACIHPAQVPIINDEYGPSPTEVEHARGLIAAFDVAIADGKGAVAFEGAMIDLPVVERARRLLARAR
ncbi:MAG: CoA ester lyase [Gammaproteobacteria bacterium]|nr:CoA ester lyase [Gammaproteobacteria bacterium]